jgi:hypothetical protein
MSSRPQNYCELFNLRHSQLRNVVERIFGAAKWRFPILKHGSEYSPAVQASLIVAYLLVHNFVHIHDSEDVDPEMQRYMDELNTSDTSPSVSDGAIDDGDEEDEEADWGALTSEDRNSAEEQQDQIAKAMWQDYITELQQRGYV